MQQTPFGRQWLEFNKSVFDHTYSSISSMQSQHERFLLMFMDKLPWLPEEGKKAVSQCMTVYKKNMEDMKAMADDQYKRAHAYFVPADQKQ